MKMRKILVGAAVAASVFAFADTQLNLTYWFDGEPAQTVAVPAGESTIEVDASSLRTGMHTFYAMAQGDNGLSSARAALFIKTANPDNFANKALVTIDGTSTTVIPVTSIGSETGFTVDVSHLPIGIHSISISLASANGELTEYRNGFFLRVPTTAEINSMQAYYMIDGESQGTMKMSGNFPLYNLDLDLSDLRTGIHSVTVFLASPLGMATAPIKSYFVKVPNGGEGIKEIRYWIDDDETNMIKQATESSTLPYSLIKMIDVPLAEFRSSSYELKMETEGPAVYGIHDLNFFAFDTDNRVVNYSTPFTESRIRKAVEIAGTLTGDGKAVNLDKIANNEIRWYAAEANLGDSLTLKLSRAATIDAFTPSGERIYSASGSQAVATSGFYATETGRYLFGIHDCVNSEYPPSITYTHIDKYAIIDRSPRKTAAASMFVLNISGNGFDHLKEVMLSSEEKEYTASRIFTDGNGKASCLFDINDAPVGSYKLTAKYNDGTEEETIELPDALEIVAPRKRNLEASAARSVFGTTLNDVLIKVKNPGNVPYWGVPFNLAAEADGSESIKLNFKDFNPNMPGDGSEDWKMYFTDNLLGTGRRGGYLPMMIPYIGPGETKEFTIVYQMPLRTHIPTYVWCGRPWSDEYQEILQLAEEGKPAIPQEQNYISASLMNMLYQINKHNSSLIPSSKGQMRAPGTYVDISGVSSVGDIVSEAGEALGNDMSALNNAQTVAEQAVGIGNTFGGIINASRLTNLDAYGIDLSDETYSSLADYRSDLMASLPDPQRIAEDSGLGWLNDLFPGLFGSCARTPMPAVAPTDIVQLTPCDPNDIIGYQDPSGGRHVGINVKTMPYTIEFENDPNLATAPAHVIKVTDIIDPKIFDLSTFAMREIKIGEKSLKLEGGGDFVKTIDMRPEINAVAEVTMTLDKSSGEACWIFRTLDPMTLEPAKYLDQGILPVNVDGNGCGEILFDVDIRGGLEHAAEFSNKASIIFDANDPIDTPVWSNITDYVRPEARILNASTSDNKTFSFDIESNDIGAGIRHYDLYFRAVESENFELVKAAVPAGETSVTFDKELNGYFVAIAVDGAGNKQLDAIANVIWGDADSNGIVDATDMVVISNFFIGNTKSIDKIAAEVTSDYAIDAQDALVVQNIFLRTESSKHTKHIRTRKYHKRK